MLRCCAEDRLNRPPRAAAPHRHSGFTLLEVVVALALLGGVMAGLLAARVRAQHAHAVADQMMTCTRLCADRVAAFRAGVVDAGEGEFPSPAGYHWRIAGVSGETPKDVAAYEIVVYPIDESSEAAVRVVVWRPAK